MWLLESITVRERTHKWRDKSLTEGKRKRKKYGKGEISERKYINRKIHGEWFGGGGRERTEVRKSENHFRRVQVAI
jgi:hypothetical protein